MFKFRKKNAQPDLDVIVIGETHTDESHIDKECKLIKKYLPEYVLYEGHDNTTPEENDNLLELFKRDTLAELAEDVHLNLTDINLGKKTFKRTKRDPILDQFLSGKRPRSYQKLIHTPLSRLAPSVLYNLKDTIINSDNPNVHAAIQYMFGVVSQHLRLKEDCFLKSDSSKLYETIAKSGAKLVGCDIDKSDTGADIDKFCEEHRAEREQTMGSRAVEYAGKRKTNKPIIMIVGQNHIKDSSEIIPILEEAKLSYKLIKPKIRKTYKDQFYHLTLEKSL
jgi:hypothetical protein